MKKTKALVYALLAVSATATGGCAAETKATLPNPNQCPIQSFKWDASDRAFDQKLDAQVAEQLASMIENERVLYKNTPEGQKPAFQSSALFEKKPTNFVSNDTFQFAVRLRQLECAAYSGPLSNRRDMIDDRFNKLLAEVNARRAQPPRPEEHAAPDFYLQRSEQGK